MKRHFRIEEIYIVVSVFVQKQDTFTELEINFLLKHLF